MTAKMRSDVNVSSFVPFVSDGDVSLVFWPLLTCDSGNSIRSPDSESVSSFVKSADVEAAAVVVAVIVIFFLVDLGPSAKPSSVNVMLSVFSIV